jgi:hypothetical protein
MRRIVALAVVFGTFAAGLGCRHVGGTCDCSHHPDNAIINPPGNPYPTLGQPIGGIQVPEKIPAPGTAPSGK